MTQNSADSLILDPRQVATGSPAGNSLENINTNVLGDGALCYVETGAGQGEWQLQKTSTLPAGLNVVVPTAGPGRWLLMGSAFSPVPVPSTDVEDIWVDGTNGTANGTGTEADPFLTLAQVALRIGTQVWHPIAVHLLNSPAGGFILDELAGFRAINAPVVIIGEGDGVDAWEELFPPTLIDSMVGTLVTCTTAAPGWTVDEWANACKAEISNPDGSSFGFYSVMWNDAGTLHVGAPKSTNPPVGSSVRIVRPITAIAVPSWTASQNTNIFGGTKGNTYSLLQSNFFAFPSECVHWVNLRFTGSSGPAFSLSGNHNIVGCVYVSTDTTGCIFQVQGQVSAGMYDARLSAFGFSNNYCVGNGLVIGNVAAPVSASNFLYIFPNGEFVGSIVTRRLEMFGKGGQATFVGIDGWRFTATSASGNCILCNLFSYIKLTTKASAANGESYAGLGTAGSGSASAYFVDVRENSVAQLTGTIRSYTPGHLLIAKDGSYVHLESATFVPANVNSQIRAETNAVIKLSGRDYAELGPAIIGAVTPLTRPKGAWLAGDSVITQITLLSQIPRDGMPAIFRSA